MTKLALLAGAAMLALAGEAHAQSRPLAVGANITGTITDTDRTTFDGARYDEYAIDLQANQSVLIRMTSSEFDSYLEIGRGRGEQFETLRQDDDGGGELNARLPFTADAAGRYTVRARTLGADMQGAYTLTVDARNVAPPPAPTPIAVGQSVQGTLTDGGARIEWNDSLYVDYLVQGRAGERFAVEMRSEQFNPAVEVFRGEGETYETIAGDDDSLGENDARALVQLPADGEYTVRAYGVSPEMQGDYSLTLAALPPPGRLGRPVALRKGVIAYGELTPTDGESQPFQLADLYSVRGRPGETVTVTMRSEAFDSFLDSGAMTPAGFAVIAADDDSAGDLNAQLTITFQAAGTLLFRASALGQGTTGTYSIVLE